MTDFKSNAGDELDRAILAERIKAATKTWEFWIIAVSILYLFAQVVPWAWGGFQVVGR